MIHEQTGARYHQGYQVHSGHGVLFQQVLQAAAADFLNHPTHGYGILPSEEIGYLSIDEECRTL